MLRKLLWIVSVYFDVTGKLLTLYSVFIKYLRKKWEYNEAVHHPFTELKPFRFGGRSCIII